MDVCARHTWAKGHGCAPMAVELAGSWGLALQLPATHAAVAHRGAKGEFVPAQHTIGRRSRMSAVHHYPIHMQTQKSANTVSGMASTPSVHIYIWLYENIIDLKQSCFFTFNYTIIPVDLNEYGANSASCRRSKISTFWKFAPFLSSDLTACAHHY